jgi:gamma-glutamylcyclotransferase (GGCT)/AIG2-like uncharacterized protein YtfP
MPNQLFVYGTLRSQSGHPMARRLARQARLIGKGSAPGALYDLGAYPGAVFSPDRKRQVTGEIFALTSGGRLLRLLDAYEGCASEDAAETALRRIEIEVRLPTGSTVEAWTYALETAPAKARWIDGGDWILHLRSRTPRALRA